MIARITLPVLLSAAMLPGGFSHGLPATSMSVMVSAPTATLTPTSLTFSAQALDTTSHAKTITLTNSGTTTLIINSIVVGGTNAGDFVQTNNCGSALLGSCTISVVFKPRATGTRTAVLSITDDASGTPQHVALSGIGTTAKLSPTSVNFGTVAIGVTSSSKIVTLTNIGTNTLTINGISISGTNLGDFSQTHNCVSSLSAGATCSIYVRFKPTTAGTRTAALNVSDSGAGSPQKVSLIGLGTTAKLSPTSLNFGTVTIGFISVGEAVTLTNVGSGTLNIAGIAITGTNASDFAETNGCGPSLVAASSCSINVVFNPRASGTRTAALTFTDSAAGSPQKVTLSGIGTTAKFSPTSLNFGSVAFGTTSSAKVVTLTNVGTAAFTIVTVAITGTNAGDFVQTNTCGSSLSAGASCNISVKFKPTATGTRTAALSVADSAAGSPQGVSLTGAGVAGSCKPFGALCGPGFPGQCCSPLQCAYCGIGHLCCL
jgi:Abnormal spindle-like microcephaly-assoc'd, ASPM-SPD-2-Hydin